jgi:signal transduction histidine kinase
MRTVLAPWQRIKEEKKKPLWGWIPPWLVLSSMVVGDTLYFMQARSAILPGTDFTSAIYEIVILILALALLSVRYFRIGLLADLITIIALWTGLIVLIFIAAISNSALLGASSQQLADSISQLRAFGFLIPALILLTLRGRPEIKRYSLVRIAALFGIASFATVLSVLYFTRMLTLPYRYYPPPYSDPLTVIGIVLSMFVAAVPAVIFLREKGRRIFENSFAGLILFISFGLTGSLIDSFHPAFYTYWWYLAIIFVTQSYFFIVWGLMLDFAASNRRKDAIGLAIGEIGNQLMQSAASRDPRALNHYVVSAIHSILETEESFTYVSKDGMRWRLESSVSDGNQNMPALPREFNVEINSIKPMEHGLFFTLCGEVCIHTPLEDVMNATFLAGICRSATGTLHLVGIREKERITWFEEEKTFLAGVVAIFGSAITERETVTKESETLSRLLALISTGRLLEKSEEGKLGPVYSDIVDTIIGLLNYEYASVWLVDGNDRLKLAASNWDKQIRTAGGKTELSFREGMIGRVASTSKPILANDVTAEAAYVNLYGEETRSEYAVPIILEGRVAAVLDVQSAYPNYFQDIDVRVIDSIANLLGSMIRNSRLYSEVSQGRKLAETRMHLISHDIRNILQAIITNVEVIKLKGKERPEVISPCIENLNAIKSSAVSAKEFLNNVLEILRLEAGNVGMLKDVEIVPMIEKADAEIRYSFPEKKVICHIIKETEDCPYRVNASAFIAEVFSNLFSNSIKYSDGDAVEIWIKLSRSESNGRTWITIDFSDNGRGIDPKRAPEVFERFNRGASGSGLGLSLVKEIIESSGGHIEVRERVPGDYRKGTTFSMRLIASESTDSVLKIDADSDRRNASLL